MIINGNVLREFEDSFTRKEGQIPPQKAFHLFSAMWQEALTMGVIPFDDPLEGIETDVKMVRILNLCLKK